MANPTKPKDAKPRAESEDMEHITTQKPPSSGGLSPVILAVIIAVVVSLITVGANYYIMHVTLGQKLAGLSSSAEGEEAAAEEEDAAPERGIILDLGEFILNLADTNARKFLKVDVAIELSKKETDPSPNAKPSGGGGHGHGAEPAADPMKEIEAEMNQYKPAIRDSVISILSSKTAEELATTPGKELAKEQIKESINSVFDGDREVLRVSFGSFFIQ
ncbi:MAG: flagellar basal body-associated FliL family protein [Candidatus Gastranaerophilales bacterium]|nr:flagellar basal body-associated FliL family protein [Candidatus Gastranaerophilales bacterium]